MKFERNSAMVAVEADSRSQEVVEAASANDKSGVILKQKRLHELLLAAEVIRPEKGS